MAYDLWGPSFPEEESSSYVQPEWQSNFYFDMIEENALNEKSCIQVLMILITKADIEIDKLEKDLILLRSELALAEHEKWYDYCCNALIEKINCLDTSIRTLKNKNENDIEVFLLMHTEPAEKLHEIVEAQLKSFCHEKNEQNEQSQNDVLDSRSGSPEQLAALHKSQSSSSLGLCLISKEGKNGPSITPKENCTVSNPSMKLELKKANSSETELTNADVKDPIPHSLPPAAGLFDEKKVATILDIETAEEQEFDLDRAKELAAQFVNNSDQDASKHSAGHLNKKKNLSPILKNMSEEETVHTPISAADMLILDSSSDPVGMRADLSKKVKDEQHANIVAKDLDSITLKQTTDNSNDMKVPCKSELKVNGCQVQGLYTASVAKIKISNSCLNPEHKGNILKADKLANTVVKTISPDTLRDATGLNGKEKLCDMEEKLCDFAVKSVLQGIKKFKVTSTDKERPSNSSFKGEGKRKDCFQVVMQKEAALGGNEHSAVTSLTELQEEMGIDKTIKCLEGKAPMEEVQMAEIAASGDKLVTNLNIGLERGKVKTNMESATVDVGESGFNSKENVSFPKGKRPWKNANDYTTSKTIKRTFQHRTCAAGESNIMTDVSRNTMTLQQKNCEKLSSAPIVPEITRSCFRMDTSKLHGDINKNTFAKSEASVDDSHTKGVAPCPSNASNLMKMNKSELRAIAKEKKLTRYWALKKEDLVKRLENCQ